jgi:L-alanine-DL-glutamate epimerase-like enolase superfamily enzyme
MIQKPLFIDNDIEYPLLATLHAKGRHESEREIEQMLAKGYQTIKVKVGLKDVESDIQKLQFIQEVVGNRAKVRIDANQAYNLKEAVRFVTHIDPENIELFEQPFPKQEWDAMKALSKYSKLPLMLDESICSEHDIERVILSGCAQFVKFKLMKAGSIDKLKQFIRQAQQAEISVVLGNGVAGEVGNLHEILVANSLLRNAGEMNGFLKHSQNLFCQPLKIEKGNVRIPKGFQLEINMETVSKLTVNEA